MELAVAEPTFSAKSNGFNLLAGGNYETTLTQSIQQFLNQYGKSDSSDFVSILSELVQVRLDPPMEAIWALSAASFKNRTGEKGEPLDRISLAKDVFQFLTACSASSSASKSIGLLAPVIFEVYSVLVDVREKNLPAKKEKKVMREIEALVKVVVGYISVCFSKVSDGEDNVSSVSVSQFEGLVRLWIHDRFDENEELVGCLKFFFPLVSEEICREIIEREFDVNYLAGVITMEAFLLRLCLQFRPGVSESELQREIKTWAVGSISAFQNSYFFGVGIFPSL